MLEALADVRWARLLVVALVGYGVVALVGLLFAERLIFQPPRSTYAPADLDFIRAPVGDGASVAVLHLPSDTAHYTILYSHGNAEDLGHVLPLLRSLRELGFGVVAYDYRGYGQSTAGPPTARKAVEDAEAVYRFAVRELGIRSDRLILFGSSVGSGPTLELAVRHDAAGVILQSAFTSTYRVITRIPMLPFDRFPNLMRVRELQRPLLVIHGTRDRIVAAWHGRRLFAEAAEPKQALWVDGAGHNDVPIVAGDMYAQALARFVDVLGRPQSGSVPP